MIVVVVEAKNGRVAWKAVRAEASVWGLVLGPVTNASMPASKADSKLYEACKHASMMHAMRTYTVAQAIQVRLKQLAVMSRVLSAVGV